VRAVSDRRLNLRNPSLAHGPFTGA